MLKILSVLSVRGGRGWEGGSGEGGRNSFLKVARSLGFVKCFKIFHFD